MAASPAVPAAALSEILTALDSILEREENGLEGLLRLDAKPRAGGRDQGLDYAIANVTWALGLGHELRGFLAALAPHEADLRALASDRLAA